MTLDPRRLAMATSIVTAILWIVCSAIVFLFPRPTLTITGYMVHADLSGFGWSLSWGAVLMGLVGWTISTAVVVWLLAWTYNRLGTARSA